MALKSPPPVNPANFHKVWNVERKQFGVWSVECGVVLHSAVFGNQSANTVKCEVIRLENTVNKYTNPDILS